MGMGTPILHGRCLPWSGIRPTRGVRVRYRRGWLVGAADPVRAGLGQVAACPSGREEWTADADAPTELSAGRASARRSSFRAELRRSALFAFSALEHRIGIGTQARRCQRWWLWARYVGARLAVTVVSDQWRRTVRSDLPILAAMSAGCMVGSRRRQ